MADVTQDLARTVARLRPVNRAVRAVAVDVLARAVQRAQAHRDTGDLADSLRLRPEGGTDWLVVADDPLSVAKEYGHTDEDTGRPVRGLFVLTGAAADVAGTSGVTRR